MTHADRERFDRALASWQAQRGDGALEEMLSCHASTRERLPLARARAGLEDVLSRAAVRGPLLDLACGIFPVLPASMGLTVYGMDISGRAVLCVNDFALRTGANAQAVCADVLADAPEPAVPCDAALLLKLLPLLERQKKGSARALLARLDERVLIVSFPTRTLGGRNVGMEAHYSRWMEENLPEGRRVGDRFLSGDELFYLLERA